MLRTISSLFVMAAALYAQPAYDLLLKGGRVIDPKNHRNGLMDVAITGGKIARVAANIPASQARKTVNVAGLYVTPGLIDIHVHAYASTGQEGLSGDESIYPDGFSFRTGVTTMVDAGTAGWRTFPDFKQHVIDRAQTRVLAFLDIVGIGMTPKLEDDIHDMDPEQAANMAKQYPDTIVGFKSAHYAGPGWYSIDNAVKAGTLANLPVMVDFGRIGHERTLNVLFMDKLRPGDIYTHCFSGHRLEMLPDGQLNPIMEAGRKRGIIFDLGHGGGSFYWNVADAAYRAKFYPDSISTDLHTTSMNVGMKDMLNTMSKVLALGSPLEQVIRMSTWQPAQEIRRTQLGNLDTGAGADVTVLRLDHGHFGFVDSEDARMMGTQLLVCEMTLRNGKVVWDLNGRSAEDWKAHHYKNLPGAGEW